MAEDVTVPEAPGLPRVASKAPLLTVLPYPLNAPHPTAASRRHQQARAPWPRGSAPPAVPGPAHAVRSPRERLHRASQGQPPPPIIDRWL